MRRTQSLKVYISNAERARLDEAAGFQPLSDWAREVLLAEAGK